MPFHGIIIKKSTPGYKLKNRKTRRISRNTKQSVCGVCVYTRKERIKRHLFPFLLMYFLLCKALISQRLCLQKLHVIIKYLRLKIDN